MSENFSRYRALGAGVVFGALGPASYTALIALVHDALKENPERAAAALLVSVAQELEQFHPVVEAGR